MTKILRGMFFLSTSLYCHYHFFDNNTVSHTFINNNKPSVTLNYSSSGKIIHAYNESHQKITPLEIFGAHNLHFIGIRQQQTELDVIEQEKIISPLNWGILNLMTDEVITALNNRTDLGTYGQYSITGNFSCKKGNLHMVSPSYEKFHLELTIPFSTFSFSDITYTDLTPATGNGGFNLTNAHWTNFKATFDSIFAGYLLSKSNYKEKGLGDIHLGLHYTHSFQDKFLLEDKLFASISQTLIIPTSKQKNENQAFSCPQGYDGHWGFKTGVKFQTVLNYFLSFQTTVDTILFASNDKVMRLKTYPGQEGFLYLATNNARRHKGSITTVNATAFILPKKLPFSFSLGYAFTHANKTVVHALNGTLFEDAIVNSDTRFAAWSRHALELVSNYNINSNFTSSFIFSKTLGGKNIFIADTVGFSTAFSLCYEF